MPCSDQEDYIEDYYVMAGWLMHGGIGWFASIFSGITGNPVTHWWIVITTKKRKYYCC